MTERRAAAAPASSTPAALDSPTVAAPKERLRAVDLADAFGVTAKLLGRLLTERLEQHGSSMPRFRLLVELTNRGPLRLTDLATRVGVSQGTASTLTEALARDGLVKRDTDPDDKRATQLAITPQGRQRTHAWLRDYETAAEDIFGALPEAQWPALKAILDTLTDRHGD